MRKLIILAALSLVLVWVGASCGGHPEPKALPPPDSSPLSVLETQTPFFAVARSGRYVVAANSNGFFRANLQTKIWERCSHPDPMPTSGRFTTSLSDTNCVFFCSGFRSGIDNGLYASHDAGATWVLVSQQFNFLYPFQNKDGRIYATVIKTFTPRTNETGYATTTDKSGRKQYIRSGIVVSSNGGRTWRDITANIGPAMSFYSIFPDPDAPKRVCIRGNALRGYVIQATNGRYTQWKRVEEWEWRAGKKTDDEYLNTDYFATTVCYMHRATIRNYFDYDFGSCSEIPAFFIDLATNHMEFTANQSVQFPITIKFLPDLPPVKLADATNSMEFWGIRCICPDGERVEALGRSFDYEQVNDSEKLKRRTSDLTGFHVVELSSTNSYSRTVALNKLSDFSIPGTYQVRLRYDSTGWGWEDRKRSGIWGGGFPSATFYVTIKP